MKASEMVAKAKDIALNYKTLYIYGCFGAPMNEKNKIRYTNNYAYNKQPSRKNKILNASYDTFGFDCVNLLKGILWGWNGNVNASTGININTTMVNEGSSALPYQPYGVGKWYKYGAVGKIVFTGASSESYGVNANWDAQATNILHTFTNDVRNTWKIGQSGFLSNKFICIIESGRDFAQEMITCHTTNETPYFFISYDRLSDVSSSSTVEQKVNAFKQWLSSNNVTLYYILANPTVTEITYQPLIDQLNELEKAMSKDGQTNISQVNNDLPFIISASALKEWSV